MGELLAPLRAWLEDGFRDPPLLLALLAAPLVYRLAARAPAAVVFSSLGLVAAGGKSLRARLATLPAWLLAAAAALLAVALAGPRTGDATTLARREGIAIAMVVDQSGSMAALDFERDDRGLRRIDVVKQVFREFVAGGPRTRGRPDDLIGLVAFGSYADGLCPLTLDHGSLLAILDDLDLARQDESGTAIGEGLALAVARLRENAARSKVAILLSDGVQNEGQVSVEQAAELAASEGIKVYTIGAGRTGFAPMLVEGPGGMRRLERTYFEMDPAALQGIAERTGGRYFHATDADSLADVVAEIDALERSEVAEIRFLQYEDHYAPVAAAAATLIGVALLASGTVLRRLP